MHNGQSIWITLKAPEKKPEPIDGTQEAFDADHPGTGEGDATDLFAQTHGGPGEDDGDSSEGGETDAGADGTEGAAGETNTPPRATLSPEAAWPFPKNQSTDGGAPPQHLTEPKVSKASRKRAKAGAEA